MEERFTDRNMILAMIEEVIGVEVHEHVASISRPDLRYFFNAAGEITKIIGYEGGRRVWLADEKGRRVFSAMSHKAKEDI